MGSRKELENIRKTEDAVPVRKEAPVPEPAPGPAREREVGLIDGAVPL